MVYTHLHQAKQCENLLNVLKNDEFCDVTFVIGDTQTEFKANRIFLASISPVFKAMLYGQMQESKVNAEIEINDIEPDGFESVLNYAYCNDPKLTENNIIAVRCIADKYQISSLSQLCDDYFSSYLNTQNICSFLNASINMKLDLYVTKCQQAIKSKLGISAYDIIKSESFLKMNITAMSILIQSDGLSVREEDLWEAVLKWADHETSVNIKFTNHNKYGSPPPNKRQKLNNHNNRNNEEDDDIKVDYMHRLNLLKQICPFIRFGLMNAKYIVKNVRPSKCLSDTEIADILCFIQCNDEKCGKFSIKPRDVIISLKWHDQYKSDSVILENNNFTAKAIESDRKLHHKYAVIAQRPVLQGIHCWRWCTKQYETWCFWGISHCTNYTDKSYKDVGVYGICGNNGSYKNGQRSQDIQTDAFFGGRNEVLIDMLLDLNKGELKFKIPGTDTEAKMIGIPKDNDEGWVPHCNVWYANTKMQIKKIPARFYGKVANHFMIQF